MSELQIKSKLSDYKVFFSDTFTFLEGYRDSKSVIFVIDMAVWKLHRHELNKYVNEENLILLEVYESMKNLNSVQDIYDKIMMKSPKRNMTLISLGGGIMQDVTGFVASSLYRGINWIFVPTTLLAQSDSCIGSKTSLNYKDYKNLIGTFYPPSEVYISFSFVKTLNDLDYYSGLGEVAKLHLLGGQSKAEWLLSVMELIDERQEDTVKEAIRNSLLVKQTYIESDEFDNGKRNMLNYGHCFGHAIEAATQFAIPHGQAIIIGMIMANGVARKRGILTEVSEKYIADQILLPLLKIDLKNIKLAPEEIVEAMAHDKKRTGDGLALIMLLDGFISQKVNDLSLGEAGEAIVDFIKKYIIINC